MGWNPSFLTLQICSPLPKKSRLPGVWSVTSQVLTLTYIRLPALEESLWEASGRRKIQTIRVSFPNMALGKGSWSGARADGEETVQKGCYCPNRNGDGLAVEMRRDWWLWQVLGKEACGSANMLDSGQVWESVSWEAQVSGMSTWVAGGSIETRREQFTVSNVDLTNANWNGLVVESLRASGKSKYEHENSNILAMRYWVNHLTSLGYYFFICKNVRIMI